MSTEGFSERILVGGEVKISNIKLYFFSRFSGCWGAVAMAVAMAVASGSRGG